MTSITPPAPDATANQFKRSIVLGNFAVCDRFQYYDSTGTPSGTIIDTGNSVFYGNVTVKGTLEYSSLELTNYYTKTQSDSNYANKTDTASSFDTIVTNYYNKTSIDSKFTNIINGTTSLTGYYTKTNIDGKFDNITNGTTSLTAYYTKTNIDGKFTDLINGTTVLNNYYNKTYIDGLPTGTNYLTKSGTNLYYTGGNFGIGKVPTTKLDIDGDVKISGTFTLGNVLKYGGTSTNINIATNLTFPLHTYYYVYQNSTDGFLDIRLPDVHNQTMPPFQFTIVNMYPADTYGLVPYSSSASTPTFLYIKTGLQLASRNQVYNVSSSTSIFLTIHYFDKNWYIM